MNDLWPADFQYEGPVAPVVILKEQAALLGKKTRNLIEAKVDHTKSDYGKQYPFAYSFGLVAPTLGNYRYKLFTIFCGVLLYPVVFRIDRDIAEEIPNEYKVGPPDFHPGDFLAQEETEFMDILRRVLGEEKTRRVIAALLAQVEGETASTTSPF